MSPATLLHKLTQVYGKNITVSRVNGYNIIHLDNPGEKVIRKRIKEVLTGQIDDDLDSDCLLCQDFKDHPHDIVYFRQ